MNGRFVNLDQVNKNTIKNLNPQFHDFYNHSKGVKTDYSDFSSSSTGGPSGLDNSSNSFDTSNTNHSNEEGGGYGSTSADVGGWT